MKKIIFSFIFLLSGYLNIYAQVTFSGTLYNSPAQKVYLISLYYGKVDSAVINPDNPRFTLKGNTDGETFYTMFFQKKGPFVLNQFIAMPGEHIVFSYDVENKFQNRWIDVTGSPFTFERISAFKKLIPYSLDQEEKRKEIDSIRKYGGDTTEIVGKLKRIDDDEIQKNLICLQLFDTTRSARNASQMFNNLRTSSIVPQITKDSLLQAIKARFPGSKYIQGLTTVAYDPANEGLPLGIKAPDIVLKDVDGQDVALTRVNHKYLLIDFWASWCKPCRTESPNLKKTYDKFRERGFQILSVSIDADINKWKGAIAADSTSAFMQVIDTDASKSEYLKLYKIVSIPANFLIDESGKIIAKNMRDDELYKEMEKLMAGN